MDILLVYPKYPDTFWSFKHALKFISKKAVNPPLGLMTISSMLPKNWNKKLVDLNIEGLRDKDLLWADFVFISAMNVQKESVNNIIKKCRKLKKKLVCGGPLFTEEPENYSMVDHLVLNEGEITLPMFLKDLENGNPKSIYKTNGFADIKNTPLPAYTLAKISKYNTINLQLTRGCPFTCEFCDITSLFGHKVRMKSTKQILGELKAIYKTGWRGNVFFVDDNFIGNKRELKAGLLPSLITWMKNRAYPFTFATEASINLADDDELLNMMARAGFTTVFVGIETTEEKSLAECGKTQNRNRDLVASVHKIQAHGMEVTGGFILGFDNDSPNVFPKTNRFYS